MENYILITRNIDITCIGRLRGENKFIKIIDEIQPLKIAKNNNKNTIHNYKTQWFIDLFFVFHNTIEFLPKVDSIVKISKSNNKLFAI